jgi:hypothetical protein
MFQKKGKMNEREEKNKKYFHVLRLFDFAARIMSLILSPYFKM